MFQEELSQNEQILRETVSRVEETRQETAEQEVGIMEHIMNFAAIVAVVGTAAHLCLDVAERVQSRGKGSKKK